jgi:hypothetical protein
MTRKFIFFPAIFILLFFGCTKETKQDAFSERLSDMDAHFEQKKKIYDFVFPDSISARAIVATYYELDFEAHSAIYYVDSTKTLIRVVRYFPDSTVLFDKLKPTKFNEFRSIVNNAEYVITENHVNYIFENQGMGYSYEHIRTDGNRY